jgi:flagellar L-ring protein precursor FlgH
MFKKLCLMVAALFILTACVADRSDRKMQGIEKSALPYESGAIFKSGFNERPLYEERRARNVGDGMIMNVVDATPVKKPAGKDKNGTDKNAGKGSADTAESDARKERRSRVDGEEPDLTNISSDTLMGPVTMTVIEVFDNGNMLITGGRQVVVDEENKYLRVTGVVDPINIVAGNTIQSTQVSEVHIQIDNVRVRADGTTSSVNEGNSIFGNYFQSVRPR